MVNYDFTLTSSSVAEAIAHKMLSAEVESARIAREEYNRIKQELYPKVKEAFDTASYTALVEHDNIIDATIKVLEFYHKDEIPKWTTKVTYDCFMYDDEDDQYYYEPLLVVGRYTAAYNKLNLTDKDLVKHFSKLTGEIQFVPENEENCEYCVDDFHQYSIQFKYDNPVTFEEHKSLITLHNASRFVDTKERLKELTAQYNTAVVAELVGSDEKTSALIDRVVSNQKLLNS